MLSVSRQGRGRPHRPGERRAPPGPEDRHRSGLGARSAGGSRYELAITSDQILFLPRFPESLLLVGGGVIGLEMATAFADLGARVTVLGREPEILSVEGCRIHADYTQGRILGP